MVLFINGKCRSRNDLLKDVANRLMIINFEEYFMKKEGMG
jgi:hypothetical protein